MARMSTWATVVLEWTKSGRGNPSAMERLSRFCPVSY
jgi:hypothetical protein